MMEITRGSLANRRAPRAGTTTIRMAIGLSIAGRGALSLAPVAEAQVPGTKFGEVVPRDVREMYDRGLQYLAAKQTEKGDWPGGGYEDGPGPVGLGLLVFLASGEDPNFGLYSNHVRRSLRYLITAQDATTGIMGASMYHHGFAMLALAEAYGAVDERNLWPERQGRALDRPGPRAGRPRRDHVAEEELPGRLAVLAGRHRRRHLGQRRGAGGAAGGPKRRHRGPRRGDRQGDRLLQVDDRPFRAGRLRGGPGRLRRIDRPDLDRHARLRRLPPQGPARVQGQPRTTSSSGSNSKASSSGSNTPATTRPRRSSRAISTPGRSGTSSWSGN